MAPRYFRNGYLRWAYEALQPNTGRVLYGHCKRKNFIMLGVGIETEN